jgi:transposase
MKQDGRKLDRKAQEAIRLMAVQRVREGESPRAVIASYGMNRTPIHKWLQQANGQGTGMRRLQARQATGRPRTLTARQEQQVFRWINGNNPLQYGLDLGLGTRQIVRDLVQREFGHSLSLASIGALLARLNLTPPKPLQRAYQRDPQAIARWQRDTYPAIARRARAEQADIYFWDESGFRADAVQGKTWGAKGHTPVVQVPGQRQRIGAASAVSAQGAFWFATYEGGLKGEAFVAWLDRLMYRRKKPLHLILDCLPAHKTSAVREYVARKKGKLTLHYLPGYAPDLNPDELVWSHAKRTGVARRPLQAGEKLAERVSAQLADIGNRPALVRSFFKHPSVAYISDL